MSGFNAISSKKIKKIASIRRISVGAWDHPKDPTIYARCEISFTPLRTFINSYNEKHHSRVSLTHVIAKIMGLCFEKYPQYNTYLNRSSFFQRDTISVFLPTVMKQNGLTDLSGIKIESVNQKSLVEIYQDVKDKATRLRTNQDHQIRRVQRLLSFFPMLICRYIIKLIDFVLYTLNISLTWCGLPSDRFGSIIISSIGAFGLEEGYIPLFPFSRTPFSMGIGQPKQRVIAKDNKPVVEETVIITFTADHRIVDGAEGAKIVRLFKQICVNPDDYLN